MTVSEENTTWKTMGVRPGVNLRAIEPEDWVYFMRWSDDTEGARTAYFIPFPQSNEACRLHVAELARIRTTGGDFTWMIVDPEGQAVGNLNTHDCDLRNGVFQYGVYIQPESRGHGYAAQAVRLVLNYYFNELRYQKVSVSVYSFNTVSLRLHEKMGFQHEGRRRRMIYTQGQFFDEVLFGMTREEFEQKAW